MHVYYVNGGKMSVFVLKSHLKTLSNRPRVPARKLLIYREIWARPTDQCLPRVSALSSNRQSCFTFSSGVWTESHALMKERSWHTSWSSPIGIILMGGDDSTTELLTANGVTQNHFQLKYKLL